MPGKQLTVLTNHDYLGNPSSLLLAPSGCFFGGLYLYTVRLKPFCSQAAFGKKRLKVTIITQHAGHLLCCKGHSSPEASLKLLRHTQVYQSNASHTNIDAPTRHLLVHFGQGFHLLNNQRPHNQQHPQHYVGARNFKQKADKWDTATGQSATMQAALLPDLILAASLLQECCRHCHQHIASNSTQSDIMSFAALLLLLLCGKMLMQTHVQASGPNCFALT
jgi:hypothetical protein